jgi:hypothetical protein
VTVTHEVLPVTLCTRLYEPCDRIRVSSLGLVARVSLLRSPSTRNEPEVSIDSYRGGKNQPHRTRKDGRHDERWPPGSHKRLPMRESDRHLLDAFQAILALSSTRELKILY